MEEKPKHNLSHRVKKSVNQGGIKYNYPLMQYNEKFKDAYINMV